MKRKQPEIPDAVREKVLNAYFSDLGKARIESLSEKGRKDLASKGGIARAAALSKAERSRIAKLGGQARAKKRRKNLKETRGNKT
jgi:hypothetical protein